MKRRGFLAVVLALVAAPVLAKDGERVELDGKTYKRELIDVYPGIAWYESRFAGLRWRPVSIGECQRLEQAWQWRRRLHPYGPRRFYRPSQRPILPMEWKSPIQIWAEKQYGK